MNKINGRMSAIRIKILFIFCFLNRERVRGKLHQNIST